MSLLDGSRDTAEVVRTAETYGIRQEVVYRVIELLASAGVLDDFPASLRAALPDYLRARIGPELACAALAYGHGDGGAAVLARRRATFARVYGAGRVGACVATFLAASGVAWVSCLDTETAEAADVTPAGLGVADVGTSQAAGVARAVHRVAPEVRTVERRPPTARPGGDHRPARPGAARRAHARPGAAPGGARGRGDRRGRPAGRARALGVRAVR